MSYCSAQLEFLVDQPVAVCHLLVMVVMLVVEVLFATLLDVIVEVTVSIVLFQVFWPSLVALMWFADPGVAAVVAAAGNGVAGVPRFPGTLRRWVSLSWCVQTLRLMLRHLGHATSLRCCCRACFVSSCHDSRCQCRCTIVVRCGILSGFDPPD